MDPIKKKIEDLRGEIRRHDYLYYVMSQPVVSDKEYDDLMRSLLALEAAHPGYRSEDSPSVRVSGGVLEGFKTVSHRVKMLSLDNTYSFDEVREWSDRVAKGLDGARAEYVVELKIDGVSANIMYRRGSLVAGATRGDGQTGEDVTANIRTIRAIPLVLRGGGGPEEIEIRGEVYLDKREFEKINVQRESREEPIFANPRNAASGSLKLLDTAAVSERKLAFFGHSLGYCPGARFRTHWQYLEQLKLWGIPVEPHGKVCPDITAVIEFCSHIQDIRDTLPFDVDGVVVKVNDLRQQEALGSTSKSPRWAVAYKFPARQATTDIVKIKLAVGRTGVITPAAELAPVACGGVIIKNATLHNFDEIERLGIREGDRVLIERAGDVIPKVVKVVDHRGPHKFQIPRACPVCGGTVIKEKEDAVAYRCINPSCRAQLERGLLHFASREAMDIEGMGESVVAGLVSLDLVRSFADIFTLTAEDLGRLPLFKDKKIENILSRIEASKQRPLARLIYALGIRHVGEKTAYTLAERFGSMDALLAASRDDFDSIDEIGGVIAESVVQYLHQPQIKALIGAFKRLGVNLSQGRRGAKGRAFLSGKTVVFTGQLNKYSRSEAESAVREAGGSPSSSVSKRTDFVVIGGDPGSKADKARALGVRILTEDQFIRMMEEANE